MSSFLINKPYDFSDSLYYFYVCCTKGASQVTGNQGFLVSRKTLLSVPTSTDVNYCLHLTNDGTCGCIQAFTPCHKQLGKIGYMSVRVACGRELYSQSHFSLSSWRSGWLCPLSVVVLFVACLPLLNILRICPHSHWLENQIKQTMLLLNISTANAASGVKACSHQGC